MGSRGGGSGDEKREVSRKTCAVTTLLSRHGVLSALVVLVDGRSALRLAAAATARANGRRGGRSVREVVLGGAVTRYAAGHAGTSRGRRGD